LIVCAHQYQPCEITDYERCDLCGTYHSLTSAAPADIYAQNYWAHEHGRSTITEQAYNCDVHEEGGVSKNRFVLNLVEVETGGGALEIACAPGCLLRHLQERGFGPVVGVDVDASYKVDIEREAGPGAHLMFGYFPEVTQIIQPASFSLVVGMDIFEHIHEPGPFLQECARLLKQGGQLILVLPMVTPGEKVTERFFSPIEHVTCIPCSMYG
jgi:2-polyprenyl-3-methyl-5-hydroxy-6-metoxy-1,4-benzoquinol methylase